jgi:peptidoglycan/xylan/chitin deacetylase (PgdA/CDA1 family)
MNDFQVAIKIDVDTYLGAREGLPRLAEILAGSRVPATVFFSFGPDRAGRAVWRVLTQPGFFRKMMRTRAVSTYGLRTVLSGTLLPAPHIGRRCGSVLPALKQAGHEIGVHAWDHFAWVGRGDRLTGRFVAGQWQRAAAMYQSLLGEAPRAFAAPGWVMSPAGLEFFEAAGLSYVSAGRGSTPYFPQAGGRRFSLLEIPTTLPSADELLGDGVGPDDLPGLWSVLFVEDGLNVLTVHAEMEGRALAEPFGRLLADLRARGARFVLLRDVADRIREKPETVPVCDLEWGRVPGRSAPVAVQGRPVSGKGGPA